MRIALIGYGSMGASVRSEAEERGHEITVVFRSETGGASADLMAEKLAGCDAAIDFSVPDAVLRNAEACAVSGVPLVEGTTGWLDRLADCREIIARHRASFVYGANFSMGVNLFYRVAEYASGLFSLVEGYEPFIEERHHSAKLDSPSGTALKLRSILKASFDGDVGVASTRAGRIPGTHLVGFDGRFDLVTLGHTARTREGFAAGAVLAAESIQGRKGFWEFSEIIDEILDPT